jgi:hypothetical protein
MTELPEYFIDEAWDLAAWANTADTEIKNLTHDINYGFALRRANIPGLGLNQPALDKMIEQRAETQENFDLYCELASIAMLMEEVGGSPFSRTRPSKKVNA